MRRFFICVLDGVGAGELPDAAAYGDVGSATLQHVLERTSVPLPNLAGLGLGEVVGPLRRADGSTLGRRAPRRPTAACSSAAPARTRRPVTGR